MNPMRQAKVSGYKPLIASAIVYLPNLEGYHEQRFEVVKTSLTTMRENAGLDCGIFIWDNGSCQEFRDWLVDEYKPDHVMLSTNVGKASARAGIVRAVPPETILGVADDDMYYYPNWFAAQAKVLKTFPNVGQVSGYPVRTQMRWGNLFTKDWGRKYGVYETGKFIPEQWDKDFCTSIGRDYEWHKQYTQSDEDIRITYRGIQAYAVAHHCQFICYAGKLADIVKHDDDAMGDEKPFDWAVDNAQMLRLTTVERYVRHMGNVLDDDLKPKRKRQK